MADLVDGDREVATLNDDSALEDSGIQLLEVHSKAHDEYDAQIDDDDLIEDVLVGAEDSYNLSSTHEARSRNTPGRVLDISRKDTRQSDNRFKASTSAPEPAVLTQTSDLPNEAPKKDSLFVQDSSSTPVGREKDVPGILATKRAFDAMLEPSSDGARGTSNPSKKARTLVPPEEGNNWPEPHHDESPGEPSQGIIKTAEMSKKQELRQWLLEEFGDSVELV